MPFSGSKWPICHEQNVLLEMGDKPEKGVDVEIVGGGGGGSHFFNYFLVHLHLLSAGKVRFPLILFGSCLLS